MQKTRALAFAVFLTFGATGAFAVKGSGLAFGGEGALYLAGSGGLPTSATLLLHLPQLPLMFGIGVSSAPAIGLTVDYWAAHDNLSNIFSWYLGVGGYLSVDLVPTGFDWHLQGAIGLRFWL